MKNSFRTVVVLLSVFITGSFSWGSAELDRQYRLSTIGVLKPWDNVDGLFGNIVIDAFTEELKKDSRFAVQDLRKANQILTKSSMPYQKAIEDKEILSQVAKTYNLDTFLRTKVVKEGPQYRFTVDFVFAKELQVLTSDTFQVSDPFSVGQQGTGSESFRVALKKSLERIFRKLPFQGTITGRDQNSVTANIGHSQGVKKGDTLLIGTIDEVKVHPLLKQAVDWRFSSTGRVKVTEVDDGMTFGEIDVEETGRQIARNQKILQISKAPELEPETNKVITDLDERTRRAAMPPQLGYLSPGLVLGSYSRESSTNSSQGFKGNGTHFGFKGEGEVWLTSQWFADLSMQFGMASYSQKDISTQVPTAAQDVSAKFSQIKLGIGYFLHLTPNFFGPKAFGRVRYQNTKFSLPNSATEKTSTSSFNGFMIGLGGDLPLRADYGAMMAIDFGVINGGKESGNYYGSDSGTTAVDFLLGGYFWLDPKMKLQVNFEVKSYSLDFVNGATVSNRIISIGPSLLFYF